MLERAWYILQNCRLLRFWFVSLVWCSSESKDSFANPDTKVGEIGALRLLDHKGVCLLLRFQSNGAKRVKWRFGYQHLAVSLGFMASWLDLPIQTNSLGEVFAQGLSCTVPMTCSTLDEPEYKAGHPKCGKSMVWHGTALYDLRWWWH